MSALAARLAAPMLDTDAGAIATSAIPWLFVSAVSGLNVAMAEPLSVKLTSFETTGMPAASFKAARAMNPPPSEIPLTALPSAFRIVNAIVGAAATTGGVVVPVVPAPVPVPAAGVDPALPPPPPQAAKAITSALAATHFKRFISVFQISKINTRFDHRAAARSVIIFGVINTSISCLREVRSRLLKRLPR